MSIDNEHTNRLAHYNGHTDGLAHYNGRRDGLAYTNGQWIYNFTFHDVHDF